MKIIEKSISVVAVFYEDGKMRPARLRITNEDEESCVIAIDEVLKCEGEKLEGRKIIKYKCQVKVNGISKICELRYDIINLTWTLYKVDS